MNESVNDNVTAKEGNSERVPQRFSFENSGVRKHKKGEVLEEELANGSRSQQDSTGPDASDQ